MNGNESAHNVYNDAVKDCLALAPKLDEKWAMLFRLLLVICHILLYK